MRYTGEVKFRFVGPREECIKYIPDARKVLGMLHSKDRVLGGLDIAYRKVTLPNGVIIEAYDNRTLPVLTINATVLEPSLEDDQPILLRLRWEPEGILLTPTTIAEPYGWGLPSRNGDETGEKLSGPTAGGSLPQMLLNRYANNKYHDKPQLLNGLPEGTAELFPQDYIPANTRQNYEAEWLDPTGGRVEHVVALRAEQLVSYAEVSEAAVGEYIFNAVDYQTGVAINTGDTPIFTKPQELINEPMTAEWHSHRPEEVLYENITLEYTLQATNDLRVGVGETPVNRPLRGEPNIGGVSAEIFVDSNAGVFAHSYYGWPPGSRTAVGRSFLSLGTSVYGYFSNNTNENILIHGTLDADLDTPEEVADWIIEQWELSPRHYDNMVNEYWSENTLFPYHAWTPAGTKGAEMHIGYVGGGNFDQAWNPAGGIHDYSLEAIDPPIEGATVWAQAFTARETWLPPYSTSKVYDLGRAGTLASGNPYGRDYYTTTRKVAYKSSIYELPEGNETTAAETFGDVNDEFQTILGVAPFERLEQPADPDADPIPRTWLRVAYWKSSEERDLAALGSRYGTLVVVVFPADLGESPILPWLPGDDVESWEEEYRQTFTEEDGWVPECEGAASFNKAGTKFILELEQAGDDFIYEGISRQDQVNRFAASTTIDDIKKDFFDDFGLFNIQRIPHVYDATGEGTPTFTQLLPDRDTLVADVNTGFDPTDDRYGFFYEVTINGDYPIFPHFLVDEEGVEQIEWVVLRIDEHWLSSGQPGNIAYPSEVYDPTSPTLDANNSCRGYRHRKMVFPSGKEITYMQQYMIHNFGVEWDDEQPKPPGFHYFPGTGENYLGVIHYLDVENEHIIYSKQGTVTYNKFLNTDPLGSRIPDDRGTPAPNDYSWTRGGSVYLLDAFKGSDRVQDTIAEYDLLVDDPLRYQSMTARNTAGRRIVLQFGLDMYAPGHTPYTQPALVKLAGPAPLTYAYNPQSMLPNAIWTDVSTLGLNGSDPMAGEWGLQSFYDSYPIIDYNVTVSTRQGYRGEDCSPGYRYPEGERYYGLKGSGAYHNVAPLFSRDNEVRAKFVEYDGRWIARVEVRHRNNHGLLPPGGQPRDDFSDYVAGEYTMNYPADGNTNPDFIYSLAGTRYEQGFAVPAISDPAVHLLANFDIDEAVGISDVYDVQPFGRVG